MKRSGVSLVVAGLAVLGSCTTSGQAHEVPRAASRPAPDHTTAPRVTRAPSTATAVSAPLSTAPASTRSVSDATPPAPPGGSSTSDGHDRGSTSRPHRHTQPSSAAPTAAGRLHGKVIVIDPGHQLGNSTHPAEINRLVNAGGFMKACNTTGTATNGGYPEATFAWRVAQALERQLQARGAEVYLTRHTNSYADWGPCIDTRGRKGNKVHADAAISLHGDGASSATRGFFVIRPSDRSGWTSDIYAVSHRLAGHVKRGLVRAGVRVSNAYGGDGFDVRGDLGTLNWSDVPIVMVELANMRNSTDARHITSGHYRRHRFARGLRFGIASFVLRR